VSAVEAAPPSPTQPPEGTLSAPKALAVSVLLHLLVIVGFPLMLALTSRTVTFERPPTFQLVTAVPEPAPVSPKARPAHKKAAREAVHKRPVPKTGEKPVAREKEETEENVDELASMLNELPKAASIATVGEFKYTWYLDSVSQNIARYWNPPGGGGAQRVLVSFTIRRDGSIADPVIAKGSGDATLDNLALRAVKLAAPFGKLPPDFPSEKLDLTCTLIPTKAAP
jgi:protein TonB